MLQGTAAKVRAVVEEAFSARRMLYGASL